MTEVHLPAIIHDLALILIIAAGTTLLFKAIRQPVVLGYIIAGFLVGPSVEWIPTIHDTEAVKVWAEIGVIFLLFALGLEFSFKKLVRVGPSASVTAIVEIVGMVGIGYLIGYAFGWNFMDSLFLGGILAISSTTIIIRAFEELGLKTRGFVSLVFGVLVVEDLVAILLMVVLSTVAVTNSFSGVEMGASAVRLLFFLTLWFVMGIFILPSFLKKARQLLNAETLLIISIGLCFAMVVIATKVGFSPALGAFIMGSILAETMEGERIEHLIHPVKDLFAAIFFVSVGILIDLNVLSQYWLPIVVITVATVIGKLLTTTLGALLSGRSLRHSVQAGMSLAQIGEFSFIIASLGLSLKVTSDFLFPIAISVSAITTFTTPYLIKSADSTVAFLERSLPSKWLATIETFHAASSTVGHTSERGDIFKAYLAKVVVNSVIVIAIFLIIEQFGFPKLNLYLANDDLSYVICLVVALAMSAPFIWALGFSSTKTETLTALWKDKRYQVILFAVEAARWTLALILVAVLSSRFIPASQVIITITIIALAAIYFVSRYVSAVYHWLERRFVVNLNAKEEQAASLPPLAPWDAHMAELEMSADSPLVGQKLIDAKIRERFGVSIALIQRGHKTIPAPTRDQVLFPGDVLQIIGTDDQISRFKQECEVQVTSDTPETEYSLRSFSVATDSQFVNKSIRESGLRETTKGLVVGIEKRGQRTLNPDSTIRIEAGDVLWIVGDRKLEI